MFFACQFCLVRSVQVNAQAEVDVSEVAKEEHPQPLSLEEVPDVTTGIIMIVLLFTVQGMQYSTEYTTVQYSTVTLECIIYT